MRNKATNKIKVGDLIKYTDSKGNSDIGIVDFVYSSIDRPNQVKVFVKGGRGCDWIPATNIYDIYRSAHAA